MKKQIEITDRQVDILDGALAGMVAECRKRAADLKGKAAGTRITEYRADLEQMAHTWEMWALEAEGLRNLLMI